jgi:hypothetical protein
MGNGNLFPAFTSGSSLPLQSRICDLLDPSLSKPIPLSVVVRHLQLMATVFVISLEPVLYGFKKLCSRAIEFTNAAPFSEYEIGGCGGIAMAI